MTAPPPVVCTGATLYGFFLKVDNYPLLQANCANAFYAASGNIAPCTVVAPVVLLLFGEVEWVGTDTRRTGITAGVSEQNVLIHVPVSVTVDSVPTLGVFTPFIFVDNPLSMAGGREVLGYAKSMSSMTITGSPIPSSLTLTGLDGTSRNDRFWTATTLISVEHQGLVAPTLKTIIGALADAGAIFDLLIPSGAWPELKTIFTNWVSPSIPQFFIKQFRDIYDNANGACYQKVTVAQYSTTNVRLKGIFPFVYDVTLSNLDIHPMLTQLGLLSPQSVDGGFSMELDFRLDQEAVL
jgi:hypothetical protein